MRRWCFLLMICLLPYCAISCTPLSVQQVRDGLKETVAEFPRSDKFAVVSVISSESYDTDYGLTCYIAGAYVAVGSPLLSSDALDIYIDELQLQGWELKRDDMRRTKVLVRGRHEWISVGLGPPSWIMELEESYQQAQTVYPTFIHLTVQYYLPGWNECLY